MIRAGNLTYMNELVGQVRNIAEGAALMTGATLEWIHPSPANSDMVTNYPLARAMKVHLDALGMKLPEAVAEEAMGSTDWGNVSYVVPSVETTYPILNGVCTWHSPDVVEASISELGFANTILVAKAMALAGLDVMRNAELRGTIHETYERQVPAATREMVQALT